MTKEGIIRQIGRALSSARRRTGSHGKNDQDRFSKFTERARKVINLAQEKAQHLQHSYIGTEHLLLGLVGEGEGIAGSRFVE
jgi:ATP-dependent Clp protease ATP-binding subunit ClpA